MINMFYIQNSTYKNVAMIIIRTQFHKLIKSDLIFNS